MGLESYEARYTLQLTEWNRRVFDRRGLDVVYVPGATIDNTQSISVGQVLDAHGRSYFSMSQMMNLVQMMRNGEVTSEDVVYFEDMFQPGIESLPYILDQVPESQRPRIYVRCLAQAIDPDDFVHVWSMAGWMSTYEKMVNQFVTGVLATNEEMVAHMRIAGWTAPIYNISGLAFSKEEVLERIGGVGNIRPFSDRTMRVGLAARFDQEKQPDFYMDLIEMYLAQGRHKDIEFAVFQGGPLRSNNVRYILRARELEQQIDRAGRELTRHGRLGAEFGLELDRRDLPLLRHRHAAITAIMQQQARHLDRGVGFGDLDLRGRIIGDAFAR